MPNDRIKPPDCTCQYPEVIIRNMNDHVERGLDKTPVFSNPYLAKYARELAGRLVVEHEAKVSVSVPLENRADESTD